MRLLRVLLFGTALGIGATLGPVLASIAQEYSIFWMVLPWVMWAAALGLTFAVVIVITRR